MADNTAIEWTDATWTPIRARYWEIQSDGSGKERIGWHCEHASEGCRHCYAEGFNRRLGTGVDFKPGELYREEHKGFRNGEVKLFLDEKMLTAPLRWKKPRMIFVCSMTDLFADFVPDEWIDRMFAVMALAPQHTFQVLTKRAKRMRSYVCGFDCDGARRFHVADAAGRLMEEGDNADDEVANAIWPLSNVWLGVSAEDQARADERVPRLLHTPAAVRWVSAEPLLGPMDFTFIRGVTPQPSPGPMMDAPGRPRGMPPGPSNPPSVGNALTGRTWLPSGQAQTGYLPAKLDWIVAGGESGRGARPMHPDWARSIRDQCAAAGVPFLFKQWGAWLPGENERYDGFGDGRSVAHWQDGGWGPRDVSRGLASRNYVMWESDGTAHAGGTRIGSHYFEVAAWAQRVGKKAAGRLLDGVEHNGFPETR